jgi:hypothetical protein
MEIKEFWDFCKTYNKSDYDCMVDVKFNEKHNLVVMTVTTIEDAGCKVYIGDLSTFLQKWKENDSTLLDDYIPDIVNGDCSFEDSIYSLCRMDTLVSVCHG